MQSTLYSTFLNNPNSVISTEESSDWSPLEDNGKYDAGRPRGLYFVYSGFGAVICHLDHRIFREERILYREVMLSTQESENMLEPLLCYN